MADDAETTGVSFGDHDALAYGRSRLGTLPSGARLALVPLPASARTLVAVVVPVGAADDPAGQAGVAHLVEHLWFSTRDGEGRSLAERLDAIGAPYQGLTTPDAVVFAAAAPPDHAAEVIQRLSGPLLGSPGVIEADHVRRELAIVAREWRDGGAQLRDGLQSTGVGAFFARGNRYATRGREQEAAFRTLGVAEAAATIARFHRLPDATVVVAGKLPAYDDVIGALPPALLVPRADAPPAGPEEEDANPLPAPLRRWHDFPANTPDESPRDTWLLRAADVPDPGIAWAWLLAAPPTRNHGERLAAAATVGLLLGTTCDLSPTRTYTLLSCIDDSPAGRWPDEEAADRAKTVEEVLGAVAQLEDPSIEEVRLLRDRAAHVAALTYFAGLESVSLGDPTALGELALWLHFGGLAATPKAVAQGLKELDFPAMVQEYSGRLAVGEAVGVGVVPAATAYSAPVTVEPPAPLPPLAAPLAVTEPAGTPVGTDWRSEVLPNGLRVLVVPDLAFPIVHAALVVRTGEPPLVGDPAAALAWRAGIAPTGDRYTELLDASVWFGGHSTGGAWIYEVGGPSSSLRAILDALDTASELPRVAGQRVRQVLPSMLARPGDGTAAAVGRISAILGRPWPTHARPTAGAADRLLRRQWRPDEALLVVVGRVQAELVLNAVRTGLVAEWVGEPSADAAAAAPPPASPVRGVDVWGVEGAGDPTISIDVRTPALDAATEPQLLVLRELVAAALLAEARTRRGIAYSPGTSYGRAGAAAWLTLSLDVAPEHVAAAREAMSAALDRLAAGPEPVEVQNARAAALAAWRRSAQGPGVIELAARTFAEGHKVGELAGFDAAIGAVQGAELQALLAGWKEREVLTLLTRMDALQTVQAALPDATLHGGGQR